MFQVLKIFSQNTMDHTKAQILVPSRISERFSVGQLSIRIIHYVGSYFLNGHNLSSHWDTICANILRSKYFSTEWMT